MEPIVSTNRLTCGGSFELLLGDLEGGRERRVRRRGRKRHQHRVLDSREERAGTHAAEELHERAVDDELVDRERQDHDADVAREQRQRVERRSARSG